MSSFLAKAIDELMPEDRHRLYEILRVRLTADVEGNLELNGELQVCTSEARPAVCTNSTTSPCRFPVTETIALCFRALLNEEVPEVELALA